MQDAKLFLAGLLHVSLDELEQALAATADYEQRVVPKRSGGKRTISVPPQPLKKIQRQLLKCVLYRIGLSLPSVFHGFVRKRSVRTNAIGHIPQFGHPRYWLRIDLKDAFTNVTEVHFRGYAQQFLRSLPEFRRWRNLKVQLMRHRRYEHTSKYSHCGRCTQLQRCVSAAEQQYDRWYFMNLRKLFLQLSKSNPIFAEYYAAWLRGSDTWIQLSLFEEPPNQHSGLEQLLNGVFELLLQLAFYRGSLPQGSPSSPFLLNLSFWFSGLVSRLKQLSWEISGYSEGCFDFGLACRMFNFSFYADDITFSCSSSFGERPFAAAGDQRTVKGMILSAIEESGLFRVNPEKIRDFDFKKGYPLITGLRLSPKRGVGLSKKQVRWLRSFMHHAKDSTDPNVKAQLQGWCAYVRMVYGIPAHYSYDFQHCVPSQIREITRIKKVKQPNN